jgi:hypothetical protein
MWDVKPNLTSSAMSACSYLEVFYRFSQGDKVRYYFFFFSRLVLHPSLAQGKRKVVFRSFGHVGQGSLQDF